MNISSSPIVMFAALLTLSGAAYSVEKGDIFSQNARAMDPIAFSRQSFNNLMSYQVMMRSSSPSDESKIIRYSFQKPGYVRMDFTQPNSGAVLIFNPVSGKVTLWPFGVGSLPILHLSPTNSLIQDERGHRVNRSDIGVLLGNIRHLQREGTTTTVGNENLAGRATTHVSVVGPGTMAVDGVHRYDVWLDNYHGLPAKVISYAPDGQRLETVLLDAMVINIRFPANFFSP
ncbi:DUF1571 domain-containing protein [Citrobacter sp. DNRA3]|uniref:LolA family protein n=1 Tax=Citrobacter sp. DNRA3 TaxID=2723054 RepID=UPI001459D2A1|nr:MULTISPECIES: DUF1571 domain-containing protein [Citrobacter]MEB1078601.1 DUF1571 domain-containing protein [Citrobacter portucalensis]NBJ28486.1 DUF1571 domain-containing protein [Citrobacter freundii]NMD73516.1 DUF1571 domain-containing protein [Citrobacter sp. DNRA3]